MTGKRFTWNSKDVMIDDTVTGNQLEVIDITEIDVLLEVLNELHEEVQAQSIVIKGYQERNDKLFKENKQLKKELQRIYDIATLNKAITIIENRYDKYLEDKDVECIPCKRKAYIECMELLDDFRDDLI